MSSQFNLVIDSAVDYNHLNYSFVHIVPVHVIIDGKDYLDGQIPNDFFEQNLIKANVSTSQPSPEQFERMYQKLETDNKPILSLHIASKLSGTYNSARIASKNFTQVYLFNTKSASIASGYLAKIAIECNLYGLEIEKTIEILNKARDRFELRIVVDNIDYLHRSGRINFVLKGLLQFFNLIPILTTKEGELVRKKMVFGKKKAYNHIRSEASDLVHYHDILILGHTPIVNNIDIFESINKKGVDLVEIGKALTTHTGPGAIGFVSGPSLDQLLNNT